MLMQRGTRLQGGRLALAYLFTLLFLTLLVKLPCSGSFWKLLEQYRWHIACSYHHLYQCVLEPPRVDMSLGIFLCRLVTNIVTGEGKKKNYNALQTTDQPELE